MIKEDANDLIKSAKEEAEDIIESARLEAQEMLKPVQDKLKKAETEKLNAIREFNDKFGPYTKKYTGSEALEELRKSNLWLKDIFTWMF